MPRHGYQPKDGGLDTTNPPDDFTAIGHVHPEAIWGDEIWDAKTSELLRQMPNGWELTHVGDRWYCGRYVKGGDFANGYDCPYRALLEASQRW